jgi:hypothetical protein
MSATPHSPTPAVTTPPPGPPRLRMKPAGPLTGQVDGAWWPRSRDLSAELPALLTELDDRWTRVSRATYNLDIWPPIERRLTIAGRMVRLGGFHSQHPDTVTLIGTSGQRLTLLVIPPETPQSAAQHALTTASHRGNDDPIDTLLAPTTTDPDRATSAEIAIQRWELDGGRMTKRA